MLQSIVFPKMWREIEGNTGLFYPSSVSSLISFMRRCNLMLEMRHRNTTCAGSGCEAVVSETIWGRQWQPFIRDERKKRFFRLQRHTCYDCLKHFCYGCEDENGRDSLLLCEFCEKEYCIKCSHMACAQIVSLTFAKNAGR